MTDGWKYAVDPEDPENHGCRTQAEYEADFNAVEELRAKLQSNGPFRIGRKLATQILSRIYFLELQNIAFFKDARAQGAREAAKREKRRAKRRQYDA